MIYRTRLDVTLLIEGPIDSGNHVHTVSDLHWMINNSSYELEFVPTGYETKTPLIIIRDKRQ